MEKSSFMGTSAMVDEIISDALQKINSGDLLPASEASSMSILRGQDPVARSTSISNFPGLRGYRSFTDDVLKSFVERQDLSQINSTEEHSSAESFKIDSTNPFDRESVKQGLFGSSEEFVPAENFMNEFDNDEKQCRDDNLFKDNRPAPMECPSMNESPSKLMKKQVLSPEWAQTTPQLEFQSFFSDGKSKTERNSTLITPAEGTQDQEHPFDISQRFLSYDPGLPYFLGVMLPGVPSIYELPSLFPMLNSPTSIKSYLNRKETPSMCTASSTPRKLILTVSSPGNGEIMIHIESSERLLVKFKAICMTPVFKLPSMIVLPPSVPVSIPVEVISPFPDLIKVQLKCSLSSTADELCLSPDMQSIPLSVVASPSDSQLQVQIFSGDSKICKMTSSLHVRQFKIKMESIGCGMDSGALILMNQETFPIEVCLSDDLGYLQYDREIKLKAGEKVAFANKSFNVPLGKIEQTATFQLTMSSPIEGVLKCSCLHKIPATQGDLRPNLLRFVWLAEDETVFSMIDHMTNSESRWSDRVVIEPCPLIDKYVKVSNPPGDPTKVVLKVWRPPCFILGRLRFYRKGSDGKPEGSPYGYRYPFVVPAKPKLRWYTVSVSAVSNIYQVPVDGKLKVTNLGDQDVFIVTPFDRLVLSAGRSTDVSIGEECKIFYGLESWRQIIKSKTAPTLKTIEHSSQSGLEPSRMLSVFKNEQHQHVSSCNLDLIPSDNQSLVRLYQLFESTVEFITLQMATENNTFFVR